MAEKQEEKMVPVEDMKRKNKQYRDLVTSWRRKARETVVPMCESCINRDWKIGQMGEMEQYTKDFTFLKEDILRDKKTRQITSYMRDYVCPTGHGFSVELDVEERARWVARETGKKPVVTTNG